LLLLYSYFAQSMINKTISSGLTFLFFCLIVTNVFAQGKVITDTSKFPVEKAVLLQKDNFYFIDFKKYPIADQSLPIGVFDSGTGGLTILNTLIAADRYNNATKKPGADNTADFAKEKFIYLADQANMPYGNYYSANKTDLLVEHILKDAQFMLANKYYLNATAKNYRTDKQQVKVIVVACNTATAYGKEYIEAFIRKAGVPIKVIGVIDAGAKGTLDIFKKDENGSVGVFATVGTIASKGYENTILNLKNELGYTGKFQVFNQGGYGLAEAVDEEPDFISRQAASPRNNYRGPSLQSAEYKIDKTLLDVYKFNFADNKMLCDSKNTDDCDNLQLNAAENYVRYHLVSLMEKIRKTPDAQPLKALVLGCTHYPYMQKEIRKVFSELYNYRKGDQYIYRNLMSNDIKIIDPAVNVATELHEFLKGKNLFNPKGSMYDSEFYISVPNLDNNNTKADAQGRFTYDYKYGRNAGEIQEYVKVVPFSKANIPAETIDRFKTLIAPAYRLIQAFGASNPKMATLNKDEKIK
jgi:glutamate racemase